MDIAPSLKQLLQPLLENKDIFAQVNLALAIASGYESVINWQEADQIIQKIQTDDGPTKDVFGWWHEELARNGDPEGHLVVGWFVRHHFATDPDGWTIKQRMDLARMGGWNIPIWMDEPATQKELP